MTQPQSMYKYIEGKEVIMEEHMLSASEIAALYGIYSAAKKPYGVMVSSVLKEYVLTSNIKINEYYYPHSRGVMRVYPQILWEKAMESFCFRNNLFKYEQTEKLSYKINTIEEKKGFNYLFIPRQEKMKNIIRISERRKENGN